MGVRYIVGDGDEPGAVLFDSTTGWAFGPVFKDEDQAEAFLTYAREKGIDDVRRVDDLVGLVKEFFAQVVEEVEA